jgi:hypothetical protein
MSSSPKGSLLPVAAVLGIAAVAVLVIVAATSNKKRRAAPVVAAPRAAVAEVPVHSQAEAEHASADSAVDAPAPPAATEPVQAARAGKGLGALWTQPATDETPNAAFPSLLASADDVDEQLARAYTYDNIQDSMLQSGSAAREAVRSRPAWSRFGQRANPEIWDAHMSGVRAEIEASGQTFADFADNSWAPIPEQMAAVWQETARRGASASSVAAKPRARAEAAVPRHARNEAAGIVQDAMQNIPVGGDATAALSLMNEVLGARKRAKSLGLALPDATPAQVASLNAWSRHADATVSGTARAITSLLA